MKTYYKGHINFITKVALKLGTSNHDFLVTAKKQKEEKIPSWMIKKYHPRKTSIVDHDMYTFNEETSSHIHLLYFHGGSMCLNGTIAHHLLIDKIIKNTNVKVTYMMYPLIPAYKTYELYQISAKMMNEIIKKNEDDTFVLAGDSAGGLVMLSAYQLISHHLKERINRIMLLSPWLDFTLSNQNMKSIEKKDFMLSVDQFQGLQAYHNIKNHQDIKSPMDYTYDIPIDIYVGTYDILYPDTCLFEERNKHVNLMIFDKQPHVFALIPVKHAKTVLKHMTYQLNEGINHEN